MKNRSIDAFICLFTVLSLAACSPSDTGLDVKKTMSASSGVDVEAARLALLEADQLFLEASETAGMAEAYRRFFAPDAIQMLNGYPPIEGRDNIYANFADFAGENAGISLTWEVEGADVAASGDLGYTWGTYFYIGPDERGEEGLMEGNYVNIWQQSDAGTWEVLLDIENRHLLVEDDLVDAG
jgi:ketosteroid isomerase-like protein